jgi:PAS domain S-box-containing protein
MKLTTRILLILAIALLPAVGVQIYNEIAQRRERAAQIADEALKQAALVKANIAGIVASAAQVAVVIGDMEAVRASSPACRDDLLRVLADLERYRSIIVFDAGGRPVCSTLPMALDEITIPPELATVLETRKPVVGRYAFEERTRQHFLPILVALKGDSGAVSLALDLDWLGAQLAALERPPRSTVVVADREGAILARHPDHAASVGRKFRAAAMGLIDAQAPGTAVLKGLDDLDRLTGYYPPAASPEGLWVSVGLFLPDLLADIDRATDRGLALIAAAALASIVLALLLGRFVVRRPTKALLKAARRWTTGDLKARVPARRSGDELARLGLAFNTMANAMERREAALRESEERQRLAIAATGLGTWHIDLASGEEAWSEEIKAMTGLPTDAPARRSSLKRVLEPHHWSAMKDAFEAACRPGGDGAFRIEAPIRRADTGAIRWVLAIGRVFFDAAGAKPTRAFGVAIDITDRHQAEEHQRLLLHELNHRVKNTLATVQAIALQTLRQTQDPQRFVESFQARLLSLSNTHNLLTQSAWQNASLESLLASELAPYGRADMSRTRIGGEPIELPARQALALGMVFHELTTNAAKYGALSRPDGCVAVGWEIERDVASGDRSLVISWIEEHGPAVAAPTKTGFGSRLIRRTIEGELGGRVTLDYAPLGLRCTLVVPLAPDVPAQETQAAAE